MACTNFPAEGYKFSVGPVNHISLGLQKAKSPKYRYVTYVWVRTYVRYVWYLGDWSACDVGVARKRLPARKTLDSLSVTI